MATASFTCSNCGVGFTLPDAVIAKYPNWTPSACMDCRKPAVRAAAPKPAPKRGGGSVTRTSNLPLAGDPGALHGWPDDGRVHRWVVPAEPGARRLGGGVRTDNAVVAQDYGYEAFTTNNRMELLGMMAGLSMLSPPTQSTCTRTVNWW